MVQCLRLCASNTRAMGSIPCQGTKIPHAVWHGQKNIKKFLKDYKKKKKDKKELICNDGDARYSGSIPGLGRYPKVGNGNILQYSCLESPMDREAWQATVHRVAKELNMT